MKDGVISMLANASLMIGCKFLLDFWELNQYSFTLLISFDGWNTFIILSSGWKIQSKSFSVSFSWLVAPIWLVIILAFRFQENINRGLIGNHLGSAGSFSLRLYLALTSHWLCLILWGYCQIGAENDSVGMVEDYRSLFLKHNWWQGTLVSTSIVLLPACRS